MGFPHTVQLKFVAPLMRFPPQGEDYESNSWFKVVVSAVDPVGTVPYKSWRRDPARAIHVKHYMKGSKNSEKNHDKSLKKYKHQS